MSSIDLHLNLRFSEVYFSELTRFLVVHITSNPKKLLYANFSNIVVKRIVLEIGSYIFLVIISQLICNFTFKIGMHSNKQAL